jgi:hypothetical protein
MAWVLDHLDDVASDMSVFHRVDDPWSMPAPRFFTLASRLHVYDGAVRAATVVPAVRPVDVPVPPPQLDGPAELDVRQQALLAPDWIEMAKG